MCGARRVLQKTLDVEGEADKVLTELAVRKPGGTRTRFEGRSSPPPTGGEMTATACHPAACLRRA